MIVEQHTTFGSTHLALRAHGFYVARKNSHGRITLEFEQPYEEVLPVHTARHRQVPGRALTGLLLVLIGVGANLAAGPGGDVPAPSPTFWTGALLTGIVLAGFFRYGLNNWWRHFTLSTSRACITLTDRDNQRAALANFAVALEQQTKFYLREHYGRINPLGLIEPQLKRLQWLQELGVLPEAEARALTTRLTGRVSAAPLLSMGQELETPYVN